MPTFNYSTNALMESIDPVLMVNATMNDQIFQELPVRTVPTHKVVWEQKDSYRGLMQHRGLDGTPPPVPRVGSNMFEYSPSVFGEKVVFLEQELVTRSAPASIGTAIDIQTLVNEGRDMLLTRQVNRMKWMLWTLVTTGYLKLTDDLTGAIYELTAFVPQLFTSTVPWSTAATATPMADFRAVKLLARGTSSSFGTAARAFANSTTINRLYANTNASDIFGKRSPNQGTLTGLRQINDVIREESLPTIVEYDGGYLDDSGAFQLWIPNGYVILFGARENGAPLGNFLLTRNLASGAGSSAPYVKTIEYGLANDSPPPVRVEVHRGFNGGPKVDYAGSIVIMNVG